VKTLLLFLPTKETKQRSHTKKSRTSKIFFFSSFNLYLVHS
jgi:hypothetical protein